LQQRLDNPMSEDGKDTDRVNFSRSHDVCIMSIDGTWRRDCKLNPSRRVTRA
jgi:hypothetical protein